jgi:hypothetical protein
MMCTVASRQVSPCGSPGGVECSRFLIQGMTTHLWIRISGALRDLANE